MAKVSIILTSYNHDKYIRDAINSVVNQTYSDWELIIWDDASIDASCDIIANYKDVRLKIFKNETNQGPVFGINKAILEVSQSKYIAIHHSDDVWEVDKLEKQVAYLDAHWQIGAVFSDALAISEDGLPLIDKEHFYQTVFTQPNRTRHEWLRYFFVEGNALCHPSVLIRRTCYLECGGYKPYLSQLPDLDMWIRLCQKFDIHVLSERLVKFRVRDNELNTSGDRPEVRTRTAFENSKVLDNYLNIKNTDELLKIFPNICEDIEIENDDIIFVLGYFAATEGKHSSVKLFGQNLLYSLFANSKIKEKYNFKINDFFSIVGKNDAFKFLEIASLNNTVLNLNDVARDRFDLIQNLSKESVKTSEVLSVACDKNVALQAQLDNIHLRHHELSVANHAHYVQLMAMYQSLSWRFTAPLRYVSRQLKRLVKIMPLVVSAAKRDGGFGKTAVKLINLFFKDGFTSVRSELLQITKDLKSHDGVALTSPKFDTGNNNYADWIRLFDTLTDFDRANMRATQSDFIDKPLISVLMPTYNPKTDWLIEAIESVRKQIYPHWELCIADDASPDPSIRPILERYAKLDPRIKITIRPKNGHISAASNSALELVSGKWVALLDHDDLLPEHALFWVTHTINAKPDVRMIYSDEDKTDENGRRFDPYFKCDWNPDLFYSHNMFSHLGVYETALFRQVGGFRLGLEGAQDYDLALRCIEQIHPTQIFHIPRVLYQWRVHAESTALTADSKPYAMIAGERAINEHFARTGVAGSVKLIGHGYEANYALPAELPLVSIIIPTRNGLNLLKQCIDSIFTKTTYSNYELLIVDNGSNEAETLSYLNVLSSSPQNGKTVLVMRDDSPFNYSRLNNQAAQQANGDVLVLLNNDIEVISPDWLSHMVSHALRPGIGAVGAKLYYPDGTLQHAGVTLGVGGVAAHAHRLAPKGHFGYFGRAVLTQSFSAVTAACLAIRKNIYQQVGGLNEVELAVGYNDVDFCLRVREAGYRNIYTPLAELYHHESATRGSDLTEVNKARLDKEVAYMQQRWGALLQNDPAYSLNLTLGGDDFSYAWPSRVSALPTHPNIDVFMPLSTPVDRVAKIMHGLKKDGLGLEIGPSHNPIAPKKAGYNVHIVDHASAEELRAK